MLEQLGIRHFAHKQQCAGRLVLDDEHKRSISDKLMIHFLAESGGQRHLGGRKRGAALFVHSDARLLQYFRYLQFLEHLFAARQRRQRRFVGENGGDAQLWSGERILIKQLYIQAKWYKPQYTYTFQHLIHLGFVAKLELGHLNVHLQVVHKKLGAVQRLAVHALHQLLQLRLRFVGQHQGHGELVSLVRHAQHFSVELLRVEEEEVAGLRHVLGAMLHAGRGVEGRIKRFVGGEGTTPEAPEVDGVQDDHDRVLQIL